MKFKSLDILKNGVQLMQEAIKTNPNSIKEIQSEINIYYEAIEELEKVESKSCRNCNLDFSFCEIFYGANSRICLSPDGFNCSLHTWKK